MPVSQDVQYEHEFSQSFCCNRAEALGRTRCSNSKTSLTGPIAKGLNLVAIVVGSLMFAFSEGGNKRVFAGIVFGIGMAIAAVNFLNWLFPGA
jgi:type IV secretory pathway VirB2 component (pilin)